MSSHNKHTSNPDFNPGDNWVECAVCGMDIYASESKTRWDGVIVCPEDWEPRHPQDFVRARKDKIVASMGSSQSEGTDVSPDLSEQGADTTIPTGTFNEDTL